MAPRSTRSKAAPAAASPEPAAPQLARTKNEQRRLFVLPRDTSSNARIVSLPHPSTMAKSRYLFCPDKGLYEFSKVTASSNTERSWLISGDRDRQSSSISNAPLSNRISLNEGDANSSMQTGYVLEIADLFVATPIDPLFFLVPLFKPLLMGNKSSFRLSDDYIDMLSESSKELAQLLRQEAFQNLLLGRLKQVSECQELGDDKLYKLNMDLVIRQFAQKARRMTEAGTWPSSMEEAFVGRQLEIPIVAVPQRNIQLPIPEQSMTEADTDAEDSQSRNPPILNKSSQTEERIDSEQTAPTLDSQMPAVSEPIKELMRIRVATNYMLSSYIPIPLKNHFSRLLSSSSTIDFVPLDKHLEEVKRVKAEVQALRSIADNISQKRGALDDEEAIEARADKKRKKEEDERKKKAETRATKQLKKVDISGMKKLSSFFAKPTKA